MTLCILARLLLMLFFGWPILMKTQMQQLCNARTSLLAAHFNETNRHLSSMSKNTAITAHNQYVEQRLRNVDAYLLKWPVH